MIWFRRILIIPLGLLFFVVLLAALLIFRINGTVFDPEFYAEQFRKADIYHFLLNDLLTSAIDEARSKDAADLPGGFNENPVASVDLTTEEIVAAANRAVPPEWLQAQVEQVLDQVGGYATGRRDSFQFTIRAKERVTDLVSESRDLLLKANAYDLLLDEVVEPRAEEALADEGILPFRVPLTGARIVSAVREVIPRSWVEGQVVVAIDEVTPYAVGDKDSFEVRVMLADQVETALRVTKDLLREADAYALLYDEVIAPQVLEAIGEGFALPYGIEVSDEEILSAMREVAPVDWVQEQVEMVIDESGSYLIGSQDYMEVTITLEQNKRNALELVDREVNERLTTIIQIIPTCAEGQVPSLAGGLPSCLPSGLDVLGILQTFDIDITGPLAEAMDATVPDSVTFTDTDLRQALIESGSEKNVELLDEVREVLSQGWSYTDQELRQDLLDNIGEDSIRVLDDIRDALRNGWTYTDADYRQDLIDAEEADALDAVDNVREWLGRVRSFQWAPYLLAFIIVVGIGFLGGRRWNSRIAWAAGVVVIASLIIFIAAGPVWSAVGSDRLEDERTEALKDLDETALLVADKGITLGITAVDDFFSGLSLSSLITFIIGLILLLLALLWPTRIGLWTRRRLRLAPVGPPDAAPAEPAPTEGEAPQPIEAEEPPAEPATSAPAGEVPSGAEVGPSAVGEAASEPSAEPEVEQLPQR
ncbi:MAG: hypothetical protein ACE5JL_04625 [Dehalococcoidia bacterium]